MKKKSAAQKKSLTLRRETLQALDDPSLLKLAEGGDGSATTSITGQPVDGGS